jgi:hydrophobic/amphiphilic exporter-1 (mainly G- bacteria), HAE1 family
MSGDGAPGGCARRSRRARVRIASRRGQPGSPAAASAVRSSDRLDVHVRPSSTMSIPRIAIHRPVTMFMISGVIVLLGAISLTRLPVDLMPDVSAEPHDPRRLRRRRAARDRGARHAADRAGGQRGRGPRADQLHSSEGSSTGPPELRVGHGPRTRRPTTCAPHRPRPRPAARRRRPAVIFKFDSNALPIMSIGVEGDFDPVTLREIAENELWRRGSSACPAWRRST